MATSGGKRVLTRDLDARVAELERKLAEMSEQIARLDERIQRMANTLATAQAPKY
jgi:chaperonin cofactor prefoldin